MIGSASTLRSLPESRSQAHEIIESNIHDPHSSEGVEHINEPLLADLLIDSQ